MAALAVVASSPQKMGTCFLVTTASPTTPNSVTKIAPKRPKLEPLSPSSGNPSSQELLRCKRRIHFGQMGSPLPQPPPAAVARRNERERNRVRMVNLGFATLRQHVPNGAKNKKMSKVETLRSAVDYIKQLQHLLKESDSALTPYKSDGMDENCYPGAIQLSSSGSPSQDMSTGYITQIDPCRFPHPITSPPCSAASSPTPSFTSDASSQYDTLSPEDEDLLDFTRWLS